MIPDIYINHYISEYPYLDKFLFTSQSTNNPLIQQGTTSTTKYIPHTLTLTNSLFDEINAFFYSIRSTLHWMILFLNTFGPQRCFSVLLLYLYFAENCFHGNMTLWLNVRDTETPCETVPEQFLPTPHKSGGYFLFTSFIYCVICKATGWDKMSTSSSFFSFLFRTPLLIFRCFNVDSWNLDGKKTD